MTDFSLPIDSEINLQLPTERNAEELFALVDLHRNYLRQHLPWVDVNTEPKHSLLFIEECQRNFANNEGFSCIIMYQGKIIGTIGTHYLDQLNKKAEIGYWLSPDFQKKGIMRKCCSTLVHYLFETAGIHRIEIRCAAYNQHSRSIPEALSFAQEAILREALWLDGKYHDAVVYGRLKTDCNN
ncbi:MAG: GNAT family N-acetyltransferase [Candidatus Melainabacteria bacterium]|nr:GNAT family N-acetyltransferase [Candidatus Melainabacteria bacterium]